MWKFSTWNHIRQGLKYIPSERRLTWRKVDVTPPCVHSHCRYCIMTYQWANTTFYQLYILFCSIVAHLVSRVTSYPLNRATSDSTPKRGQVCQQLIHHAQYQSISKHKQSIFDTRDSWITGGTEKETHSQESRANSPARCRLPSRSLSPRDWHDLGGSLTSCNYFDFHTHTHHHRRLQLHDTVGPFTLVVQFIYRRVRTAFNLCGKIRSATDTSLPEGNIIDSYCIHGWY